MCVRVVLLGHQACILGHGVECALVFEEFTGGIILNDTTSIQHDDTGGKKEIVENHSPVNEYEYCHWLQCKLQY